MHKKLCNFSIFYEDYRLRRIWIILAAICNMQTKATVQQCSNMFDIAFTLHFVCLLLSLAQDLIDAAHLDGDADLLWAEGQAMLAVDALVGTLLGRHSGIIRLDECLVASIIVQVALGWQRQGSWPAWLRCRR